MGARTTMPKRVLIFSLNYYPRFIGGAEIAIKEITDRIPPEEIEFHMVTLRFDEALPKIEKMGNVLVHRIGFSRKNPSIADLRRYPLKLNKYYFQFFAALAAARLHKKYAYDAVWAMMAHSCGIPASMFKKRHPEVQYLLTLQEGDPPEHIERLARPVWRLFRQGFTRADAVQAISTFLAAWATRMGFRGTPEVIPNGVDTKRFAQQFSLEEVRAEAQKLGKREGEVFLVTTSRLVHKNGIDTVIRALQLMPETISFLIYGIGPDEEKLRELARELGIEPRVRFMGEARHDELPRILAACDIFVRPSRSEGMGNSFIEAMAAGLPVIATQEGGISDFLFDATRNPGIEPTGWAVDSDAPQQIAEAVEAIGAHPEQCDRVTESARRLVIEKYAWSAIIHDMKSLFIRLW